MNSLLSQSSFPGSDSLHSKFVAAVDDQSIILSGLRMMLENAVGFSFAGEAATVEDAATLVCEEQPDAVVLDLWVGGNDGIGMVKRLRTRPAGSAALIARKLLFQGSADGAPPAGVGGGYGGGRGSFHPGV